MTPEEERALRRELEDENARLRRDLAVAKRETACFFFVLVVQTLWLFGVRL